VVSINPDLFDATGALIAAVLVGFIYGQRQKLPLWSTLDALTPLFATIAIGLSLSHLAAGTAFGIPTDMPWGIELWNATRHPSQIYAFIAALIIFAAVWFGGTDRHPGSMFLLFASLTSGSHLFLEAFRADSTLIFGGIRLGQVVAWLLLAFALFVSESIRRGKEAN
jgi:phosphatidylglycerol:prolipoprotein diacylglycerol transferase